MRIVSWNVNGLYETLKDASNRYSSASNYFSEILKADIVCIQEAKIQENKLEKWIACVPGYESFWAFSKEKKGYSGVVTYVKEQLSPLDAKADCLGDFDDPSIEDLCREGRLVETDHGSFVLINVYAPNAGEEEQGRPRVGFKLRFLESLKKKCDELVCLGRHVVIVGDLNVAHKDKDVHKKFNIGSMYSSEEIAFLDTFLIQYIDLFRYFHPDAEDVFSVWNQKTEARIHNEGSRIDYAVCDKGFLSQVLVTDIMKMVPKKWSDHASVILTLKEQPILPAHPKPAISSDNMKRFQEDRRQKKLTWLFSSPSKGQSETAKKKVGSQRDIHSSLQGDLPEFKEIGNLKSSVQPKSGDLRVDQTVNSAVKPVDKEAISKPVEPFPGSRDGDFEYDHTESGKREDEALIVENSQTISRLKTEKAGSNLMSSSSEQSNGALMKKQKIDGNMVPANHTKVPVYKQQKSDMKSASNSASPSSPNKQRSLTSYFNRDPD